MAKPKKEEEGICPSCGAHIEPNYDNVEIDGDGSESIPFVCDSCEHEGHMIRTLVFSHYE